MPGRIIKRATLAALLAAAGALGLASAASAAEGDVRLNTCISSVALAGCSTDATAARAAGVTVSSDGRFAYVADESGAVIGYSIDPTTGALTRIPGPTGCAWKQAAGQCQQAKGMSYAIDVALSADGEFMYTSDYAGNAILTFDRNPATGTFTQLGAKKGCVAAVATTDCDVVRQLSQPVDLLLVGSNLYTIGSASMDIFDVQPDGSLKQKDGAAGCINNNGTAGCGPGRGIAGFAVQMAVSRDGRHLYAPSRENGAILLFNRDTTNGELAQKAGTDGCISADGTGGQCQDLTNDLAGTYGVAFAPNSDDLYAFTNTGILLWKRASDGKLGIAPASCITENGSAGACTDGVAVGTGWQGAFTPDGRDLALVLNNNYSWPGNAGLTFLRRNTTTGALSQSTTTARCITGNGFGGGVAAACRSSAALGSYGNVAWAPNGLFLIGTQSFASGGTVLSLDRDFAPSCQNSTVSVPYQTSIAVPLTCSDPNGDPLSLAVASQPLNGSLGGSGTIDPATNTVRYNPPLGFAGSDTFTYTATGRGVTSAPATVTLNVAGPPVVVAQNPPPPPPGRITITLGFAFSASTNKQTKFTSLTVKGFPSGSTVTVSCTKGTCPSSLVTKKKVKKKTKLVSKPLVIRNASGTVKLSKVISKALKAGAQIRVDVTKAGMIGATKVLVVGKRKAPKVSTYCLPVGSNKPQTICS